ncbi:MLP-like protein [Forsythia ovata]|uniref:MLP-like protein n=1 Tax=Forsythia ovata TaxID=205694 RepID=A0ABD1S145_9LAMI
MLDSAQYIEGDGSSGSLRLLKFGPVFSNYVKESTELIEIVEHGRSVTYRVTDGDLIKMYDPYRVNFSFIPIKGNEREKCIAQWRTEFVPLTPKMPPPIEARDAAISFLRCFDNFHQTIVKPESSAVYKSLVSKRDVQSGGLR